MPFVPHTKADEQAMLAKIGINSIEDLFNEIPVDLQAGELTKIPEGLSEMEISRVMNERARQNFYGLNFIGAGAYEHYIPAAVWDITTRGEFMTAYTPYQAEASQGTLQLIYEYQTMMAHLMGMDVSNASLYDGASALAEAILMAVRSNKHSKSHRILVPRSLNPAYREVIHAIVRTQQIELVEIPFDLKSGQTDLKALEKYNNEDITALVIPQPNFFGIIEDVDKMTNWAHAKKALAIGVVNPVAMALLKEPGKWGDIGADMVCGEGQPLGVPLASGGPYFGFLCCKKEFVRQMPGRIVGRTVDLEGKEGFALTLQAREQHIRRAKATSNICTNQGLLVTAATIYMSLIGSEGLKRVALKCHANTGEFLNKLTANVEKVFSAPFFHETVVRFKKPVTSILKQLVEKNIQGGYSLTSDYPELGESLLVCVTETKTAEDIKKYADELSKL